MSERTTALERLERLLDEQDERIAELESENRNLKHQHEGEFGGLLNHDTIDDDESLPIPRLEIVHLRSETSGWRDQHVVYRMVYKHLLGNVVSVPLGVTRIRGAVGEVPRAGELPFRDGAHARHDAALFGWPLFQVIDGKTVRVQDDSDHGSYRARGREHRRG